MEFVHTYEDAEAVLGKQPVAVVITEATLASDRCWKDLLETTLTIAVPPPLIVTDRLADEFLWSEVLNLGGYDLLMKPFDAKEVYRVISLAWLSWRRQWDLASDRSKPRQLVVRAGEPNQGGDTRKTSIDDQRPAGRI